MNLEWHYQLLHVHCDRPGVLTNLTRQPYTGMRGNRFSRRSSRHDYFQSKYVWKGIFQGAAPGEGEVAVGNRGVQELAKLLSPCGSAREFPLSNVHFRSRLDRVLCSSDQDFPPPSSTRSTQQLKGSARAASRRFRVRRLYTPHVLRQWRLDPTCRPALVLPHRSHNSINGAKATRGTRQPGRRFKHGARIHGAGFRSSDRKTSSAIRGTPTNGESNKQDRPVLG